MRAADALGSRATRARGAQQPSAPTAEAVLDLLPDPVIACDASGRVAFWSSAAHRAYGFAADEAIGRTAAALLRTRFPVPQLEIAEALADAGHWRGRLHHRRRDGQELEVECRWLARRDPFGRMIGDLRIERLLDPSAEGPSGASAAGARVNEPTRSATAGTAFSEPTGTAANEPARSAEPTGIAASKPGGTCTTEPARTSTNGPTGTTAGEAASEIRRIAHELNNALAIVVNYSAFAAADLRRRSGARMHPERGSLLSDIEQVSESAERAVHLSGRLAEMARGLVIAEADVAQRPDGNPAPAQPRSQGDEEAEPGDVAHDRARRHRPSTESDDRATPQEGLDPLAYAPATILLVEDERPLRELCRRILSQAGYEVLAAADGPEALRLAECHDGPIDLLLTDVVMPEMLGHQVARRLRELRPATAVAYMSGFPDVAPGVVEQVRGALIDKPFTAPALLEHVRLALGSSGARRPWDDRDGEGSIHECPRP